MAQERTDVTSAQQSKVAVREQARSLLREARNIFLIYSNEDLTRARDLRQRILRLRRDKPDDTVFLAVESLPVGKDVSPERLQSALASADLAVVVCGEHTAQSKHVAEEIEQALQQRKSGQTEILSVILKPRVELPEGVAFRVQAIHYIVLFPAIKWTRIVVVGALVVLIAMAALFARMNRVAEIQRQIDLDASPQSSPIDFQRVARLEDLRTSAMWVGFLEGVRQIDRMLQRSGRESLRQQWLPPDRQRMAVVADPSENVVWVGYEKRIDALDAKTRAVVRSYNLASFDVDAYRPEPIQKAQPARSAEEPQPRYPARLLDLRTDPRVPGVLATVEYERYAQPSPSNFDGEVRGGEKEILRLARDLRRPESVGLSAWIGWDSPESPDGLDYGLGGEDLLENEETKAAVEATLSKLADGDLSTVRAATEATDVEDRIYRLARDPRGPGSLIGLEIRADKRLPYWFKNGESRRDHLVGVLSTSGEFRQVVPTTQYDENARDLNLIAQEAQALEGGDSNATDANPFSAIVPTYEPAALWLQGKLAWIDQAPIPFSADVNAAQPDLKNVIPDGTFVAKVRWLSNGSAVRFVFEDGSLSLCPTGGMNGCHRFLRPRGARMIDLTPDGRRVLVLDTLGRIYAWDMTAFGPDGWILHAADPRE